MAKRLFILAAIAPPIITVAVSKESALIISGGGSKFEETTAGNSVEVFVPSTGQHCQLPDIPGDPRYSHTMEGRTICGGDYRSTSKSCLTLTDGGWETSATLIEESESHCSWASPSGLTILFGYRDNTQKIQEDGTTVTGFSSSRYAKACAINTGDTVIITGGKSGQTAVSEYSEAGYLRPLPSLQKCRYNHGCSYYENSEGTKTFLVTGGEGGCGILSSTELLEETATSWVLAGELPTPRYGLRAANVDNRVLAIGGYDEDYQADILEYEPGSGEWRKLDSMPEARYQPAVSVIPVSEVQQFCN